MPSNKGYLWKVGNVKTVQWCIACVGIIGFLIFIGGAILTGYRYTAVRPNFSDENYDRFMNSNVGFVMGPIMIALGGIMVLGTGIFAGFAFYSLNKYYQPNRIKYSVRASQENIPDIDEKL